MGSCAYNAGMFPKMEALCNAMIHVCLKGRDLAIFGSGSWAGGGVRTLKGFAEQSGWELICNPVEVLGRATPEKLKEFGAIADAIAKKING